MLGPVHPLRGCFPFACWVLRTHVREETKISFASLLLKNLLFRTSTFYKLAIAGVSLINESMPELYLSVRHAHKAVYIALFAWIILSSLLSKAYKCVKSFSSRNICNQCKMCPLFFKAPLCWLAWSPSAMRSQWTPGRRSWTRASCYPWQKVHSVLYIPYYSPSNRETISLFRHHHIGQPSVLRQPRPPPRVQGAGG